MKHLNFVREKKKTFFVDYFEPKTSSASSVTLPGIFLELLLIKRWVRAKKNMGNLLQRI